MTSNVQISEWTSYKDIVLFLLEAQKGRPGVQNFSFELRELTQPLVGLDWPIKGVVGLGLKN